MEFSDQCQQVSMPNASCSVMPFFLPTLHAPSLQYWIDTPISDLDDTLYPVSSGIAAQITKNIQEYMRTKLLIEDSKVSELCLSLYRNYGTTMAGLTAIGYNFDYYNFHGSVHGRLSYILLKPDLLLRQLLRGLPKHKLIFTNVDKAHASRVLNRLGLEDCFDGIICFETLNTPDQPAALPNSNRLDESDVSADKAAVVNDPNEVSGTKFALPKTPVVCKPFEDAYKQVSKIAGINPRRTVFFDDSVPNLQTGKQMGLHTVLVCTSHRMEGADHALESIHIMGEPLPELWEADDEKSEGIYYSGKVAIEMPVKA